MYSDSMRSTHTTYRPMSGPATVAMAAGFSCAWTLGVSPYVGITHLGCTALDKEVRSTV